MSVLVYDSTADLDRLIELRKEASAIAARIAAWSAKGFEQVRAGKKPLPIKWPKRPFDDENMAYDIYISSEGRMSYTDVAARMRAIYPAEGVDVWHYRSVQKAVWKVARWRAKAWADALMVGGLL